MNDHTELDGIKFGGRNINNIRYVIDTVLIADSEEKLISLIQTLVQSSGGRGLKLNIYKTKVMAVPKGSENARANISVSGEVLEQIEKYKYLGNIQYLKTKDVFMK